MAKLAQSYAELEEKHQDTLDYVEGLKAEVQKAQMQATRPSSPSSMIRRKSNQTVNSNDRTNRAAAAIRNAVSEHFESEPDIMQMFEVNLNTIVNDLSSKSERTASLEGELAAARKEMEAKMTIISGLTRERSSLKSSTPLDMSVVSTMQNQLAESENQIRGLHESHAAREQQLLGQIEKLRSAIDSSSGVMPGGFPETPAIDTDTASRELGHSPASGNAPSPVETGAHQEQISKLQTEVNEWRTKHLTSMESMKTSERQLLATINDLEATLSSAENANAQA
ncbi:hypothetical protein LTS18_002576, partial [Coniosporium uncinatum]